MGKKCCQCGRDFSKFNVDFSREIICDRCTMGEAKPACSGEPPTLGAEIANLKTLFDQAKEEKQGVLTIQFFEHLLNDEFKNTEEFVAKVSKYLEGRFLSGKHLKYLRKLKQWSQSLLAAKLECGQRYVSDMESGRKPLNQKAIEILMQQDLWHWAWPRIQTTTPHKTDSKIVLQTNKLQEKNGSVLDGLRLSATVGKSMRCWRCGEFKDDLEITIESVSPYRTEYVCEDCYRNSGGRK